MRQAEARFVAEWLAGFGGQSFKVHGGIMQKSGMPDNAIFWKGFTYWLEFKVGNNSLSELQKRQLELFERIKIPCGVVRRVGGFVRYEKASGGLFVERRETEYQQFIRSDLLRMNPNLGA